MKKIPYDSPVLTVIALSGLLLSPLVAGIALSLERTPGFGTASLIAVLLFFFPFFVLPAAWAVNTFIVPIASYYLARDEEVRRQLEIEKRAERHAAILRRMARK